MTTYKIGTEFTKTLNLTNGETKTFGPYTIYNITDTRVCYTDGKSHSSGATNRKVKGSWIGIKRFEKGIESGKTQIL